MLGQILFSPKAAQVPPPPLAGNPFKSASKSLVALVHGTDVAAMVQHAIALIGGLGKLQLVGTRTRLKPNVVGGAAPPITTDPRVVQVLGALVQAEKPASALGLGARGPEEVELVTQDLTDGRREFAVLVDDIKRHAGLA
jgi:hypothetical protein